MMPINQFRASPVKVIKQDALFLLAILTLTEKNRLGANHVVAVMAVHVYPVMAS